MRVLNYWGLLSRTLSLLVVMATAAGCISEDMDGCHTGYSLMVRAYDTNDADISGEVHSVRLFVFDAGWRFCESIDTGTNTDITLNVPLGQIRHVVAWGNENGGQHFADPQPGDHVDDCFLTLKDDASGAPYAQSPDDLFRGGITVGGTPPGGQTILPIYREVGSMTVTIRNLKTFAGYADNDYSVVVRETPSVVDFKGNLSGTEVSYRPAGSFVANGGKEEFFVPPFRLLPESGLYIDIYHAGTLIATVYRDNAGALIDVEKGRLTNVLIDLKASVSVSVSLTDWGNIQVWKEF